jgi:organic hydroperoxide reductase OsmC/OhrA
MPAMHPYPHRYEVSADARATGAVIVHSAGLPDLATAPPAQFGGPGDAWSPETLLCAALADCYILTFRALARGARVDWLDLSCRFEGVLERVDGVSRFTGYTTTATLTIASDSDIERARALLERAERDCLIANSVNGTRHLEASVVVAHPT